MAALLKKSEIIKYIFIINILSVLIIISNYNYLLFHLLVEGLTVLVSYIMIIVLINTRKFNNNSTYTFIGIAYAFISSLDLMHAITYKGMNIIPNITTNTPTQLWIIARMVQSITFLLIFKNVDKTFKNAKAAIIFFLVFIYSMLVIKDGRLFPSCYMDGSGLTPFKIYSEYSICLILTISAFYLIKNRSKNILINDEYKYLLFAVILTIVSELCFTIYIGVYEASNIMGHIFKLLSFYFIYESIIKKTLQEPYEIIFNNLNTTLNQLQKSNYKLHYKNLELMEIKKWLERSLRIYRDFFEILPFPVIVIENGKIFYANNKSKELLKLKDKKELIGKTFIELVADEYKEMAKERISELAREKVVPPTEETLICKDGSRVDVEVTSTSIFIEDKEYYMTILRDITDAKKLKVVEDKLEEKLQYEKVRNEFFTNLSHELKTPINVIYSALQLQDIYFDKEDFNNVRKNNKIVKQNCMRLLKLINNLIDITKIDDGFFKPVFKYNNIVEVIENIVMSVAPYVESRKMNIIFDTEIEEQYIEFDSDLMERIMLNLISNSMKYGKIDGTILVYIDVEGDYVCIKIKDDGIGIKKDKQESVFERFIRGDRSLARSSEGSGIGLSLVKSFVEIQNGSVYLSSEENKGTEIIIKLPKADISEEIAATLESDIEASNIIKKVDLEFSDIYDL
ncbi:sensor histidine kinase [Clostridium omnivorum]|uniref:histidine kinase n=1 Tax=Clostridium omnivorum TaxID=1604902 RepID=A0ABQ5N6X4_9CLOT|nr:MASE3 domain-containing protein [Clostridium sp. E14]GLC30987.1 PAS domain-containing sensor histidine kinase [Clostridium sp. E14]